MELDARYRYRLRVKPQTAHLLQRLFDTNRFVWNQTLGRWSDLWVHEHERFRYLDACRELTDLRGRFDWLAGQPQTPQQQTIRDLYRAIGGYLDRSSTTSRPRFKRKGEYNTARWTLRGFKIGGSGHGRQGDRLEVATGTGRIPIRVVWSRPLPSPPKSVTVYRDATGRWWASFVVRLQTEVMAPSESVTGLDLGLTTLATAEYPQSDIPNPRFGKTGKRALRTVDRSLSRKRPGSANRVKAKRKRAVVHANVARRRLDYFHKHARRLARSYDVIGVEALKIKNMLANRRLARAISDAGWGDFIRILEWHLRKVGRAIVYRDPRNTTQTCSDCGVKAKRRLGLADRVFVCEECGLILDRDRNAARNLNPGRSEPGGALTACKTSVPTGTEAA